MKFILVILYKFKKINIKINNKIKKINPQEKKILEKMLRISWKSFFEKMI